MYDETSTVMSRLYRGDELLAEQPYQAVFGLRADARARRVPVRAGRDAAGRTVEDVDQDAHGLDLPVAADGSPGARPAAAAPARLHGRHRPPEQRRDGAPGRDRNLCRARAGRCRRRRRPRRDAGAVLRRRRHLAAALRSAVPRPEAGRRRSRTRGPPAAATSRCARRPGTTRATASKQEIVRAYGLR